jgi:tetratricopeptide (TPR) repeat protein
LPRERLEEALGQLVRSELIFRRGEIPHAVYTFKHTLVRDAAYAGLLKSRRVYLHAAIASALEQQFPEIVQTQPETLAHHLTEAGLIEKAIGYWLQAGKNAALRSANLEAIAHLRRGIEVTGRLPAGEGKDRAELDLQLILGPCLIATQGPAASEAVATFARARELCERLGEPPEYLQVMFWLATVSVVRGELPQALEAVAALLSAAEARDDRPALINATRGRAMILFFLGHIVEAREAVERAVEIFGASQDVDRMAARAAGQDAGVAMLALLSWVLWILGRVDEAVTQMAAALERADAVRHAHTHAYAWYYASVLHTLRGEAAIAQAYAERCLAISEQHGFRQWLGLSRAIRGICTAMLDGSGSRFDEVKAALDEYQRAGYQVGITAQLVLVCRALLSRSEAEAALELIDHGFSIVSHNSERCFEAELYRLKAGAMLMRGASDAEAEPLLEQAARGALRACPVPRRDSRRRSLSCRRRRVRRVGRCAQSAGTGRSTMTVRRPGPRPYAPRGFERAPKRKTTTRARVMGYYSEPESLALRDRNAFQTPSLASAIRARPAFVLGPGRQPAADCWMLLPSAPLPIGLLGPRRGRRDCGSGFGHHFLQSIKPTKDPFVHRG